METRHVFLLRQGRSRKCKGSAGGWALLTSSAPESEKWARLMLIRVRESVASLPCELNYKI